MPELGESGTTAKELHELRAEILNLKVTLEGKTPTIKEESPTGKEKELMVEEIKKEEDKKKLDDMEKEELIHYVRDLRGENAKRRTRATEAEESLKTRDSDIQKAKEALEGANKKLAEVEAKDKEAKKAEMDEIDKMKSEVGDLQSKLQKLEQEKTEKDKKIVGLVRKQTESSMVQQALALLNKASFKFRSKAEERGFKAEVLERGSDNKYKTEGEIEDLAEKFVKENAPTKTEEELAREKEEELKNPDFKSAPAGPKTRKSAPTDQDRLKELLTKMDDGEVLPQKDIDEMTELEERIEASIPAASL